MKPALQSVAKANNLSNCLLILIKALDDTSFFIWQSCPYKVQMRWEELEASSIA